MTRPRFALFALFALLSLTTAAKAVDKDKLRRTIRLPQVNLIFGYGVSGRGEFTSPSELRPQPEKIAEIESQLKGDATDGERYYQLYQLYFLAHQPAKGREALRQAESLLGPKKN